MPTNFGRKRNAMYYYAYLNSDDICIAIYAMPSPLSGSQYIAIGGNDQSLVGQHFNRTKEEFEAVYYYATLDDRGVVTSVTYSITQQATSATFLSITFAQYQTVTGKYWNGSEFVEPPISVLAKASTDEVNYKGQELWLSAKLDAMDNAIADNESYVAAVSTALEAVTSNLAVISQSLEVINAAIAGKANASHTHTADDLSGVVKTVNGNAPDESGNITVTSGGMTAEEILTAIKTVDGAGSGLDADLLDGLSSTSFALANHDHDSEYAAKDHIHVGYATNADLLDYAPIAAVNEALAGKSDTTHNHDTVYALLNHTHAQYLTEDDIDLSSYATTSAMNIALAGKSDKAHNHDTVYAALSHTHTTNDITGLATALAGKSDSTHNHDTVYAAIDHTHTEYASTAEVVGLELDVGDLKNDVAGKADATHSHSQNDVTGLTATLNGKANTTHSHSISDITDLQNALNSKANSSHTHSEYLPTAGGTVSGNLNVNGLVRVNNQQCLFDSGSMVTLSTNNRETMIAGNKIYSKVAISTSSDARLKENVQPAPMEDLVAMIKRMEVKKFNYVGSTEKNVGIIAQDFICSNPTYISDIYIRQCCDDDMYSFKDTELVYALVAAVQDIYSRIDNN